jgi:hypothetical protein
MASVEAASRLPPGPVEEPPVFDEKLSLDDIERAVTEAKPETACPRE